ncbi:MULTISPECIES: hypothetical protein [Parafrankia]|uniref:hypothetical protein n=1 Tax=Parafrankia TaxID=2994362 RepID=UPI001042542D|nr:MULTISPECIES: hypothetical protein [Parafrankia]MBE3200435.1 hypothetical protein [Parafrankia sp. CH37]
MRIPLPAGFDRGLVNSWVAETNGRNALLSDTIQQRLTAYPLALPGSRPVDVNDFDGSFAVKGTSLVATVESGEVHTNTTWWQNTLLAVGTSALGVVVRLTCLLGMIAMLGPAGVLAKTTCAVLGGFVATFVYKMMLTKINNRPLNSEEWFEVLSVALANAWAGNGLWEGVAGPWVERHGVEVMTRLANSLKALGRAAVARWPWLGTAANWVGDVINNWAPRFPGAVRSAVGNTRPVAGARRAAVGGTDTTTGARRAAVGGTDTTTGARRVAVR